MSHLLTHGCSLSNLPLFVAGNGGIFAAEGVDVELVEITQMSATADVLRQGRAELGTAPYIQPLIDADRENPPIMVAGSGLCGIAVIGRAGTPDIASLRGAHIGTFRGDPMEVLLHELLAAHGLGPADVTIELLPTLDEAISQWRSGSLEALTLAQPYVNRLLGEGAVLLSDGRDQWGSRYPDTVLVASARLLADDPDLVRGVVRSMLRAQDAIRADLHAALECACEYYPGFTVAELARAVADQPTCIDITDLTGTVEARWPALVELGLVDRRRAPPAHPMDFSILQSELDQHHITR